MKIPKTSKPVKKNTQVQTQTQTQPASTATAKEVAPSDAYAYEDKVEVDAYAQITHPKKRAMLFALESKMGVVTTACKAVGINRRLHYDWLERDAEYRKAVEELDNVSLDFAESQLFKQIHDGEVASTIFYLKTKGKKRGYIERTEVTGKDGRDLLPFNWADVHTDTNK
jgi:hypothetical protein